MVSRGQYSMFIFRKYSEKEYFEPLKTIPAATTEGWRCPNIVSNAALCLCHQLTVDEFIYLDKWPPYMMDYVQHERRMRAEYGLEIYYQ